jgi:hypothetical protein
MRTRLSGVTKTFLTYQNINLITQADGEVFMIGFERSNGEDFMDLFIVDMQAIHSKDILTKVATKHMFCTNGCTFHYGGGINIRSADAFDVYAVNGDSGPYDTGTTIHANVFTAP